MNTIGFYSEISLIYGALSEMCSCPTMSAGARYEYLWADGAVTPVSLKAHEYIELLFNWVESQLSSEETFPTRLGVEFPRNFKQVLRVIFKRLFRVYAHIYHSHFREILHLGMESHLNASCKHFLVFIDRFFLVEECEMAPLAELVKQFRQRRAQVIN